jgi:hypothetical protein
LKNRSTISILNNEDNLSEGIDFEEEVEDSPLKNCIVSKFLLLRMKIMNKWNKRLITKLMFLRYQIQLIIKAKGRPANKRYLLSIENHPKKYACSSINQDENVERIKKKNNGNVAYANLGTMTPEIVL